MSTSGSGGTSGNASASCANARASPSALPSAAASARSAPALTPLSFATGIAVKNSRKRLKESCIEMSRYDSSMRAFQPRLIAALPIPRAGSQVSSHGAYQKLQYVARATPGLAPWRSTAWRHALRAPPE